MALAMQAEVARRTDPSGQPLQVRIGIDTGPVEAGVIGTSKFSYDLWGDTVNTASRMESGGVPGCIQVTDRTYRRLRDRYRFQRRGPVPVRGKGEMVTWFLVGRNQ
jgi:class 3 adenylate cyclase